MKKRIGFFGRLVRNNTGVSSKSFLVVVTTVVSMIILLTLCTVLVFDVAKDGEVTMDMSGMAEVIGAVVGLLTAAGACKVFGERNEQNKNTHHHGSVSTNLNDEEE